VLLASTIGGCTQTNVEETREFSAANSDELEYFDIGDFRSPVSTESPEAQLWFDRGLAMCHAFNHEESIRCFEKAVAADPSMPMAYWGLAYAWGPNINNMQIDSNQISQATFALRLAKLHSSYTTQREEKLILALETRYIVPVPDDRTHLNEAYADAMRKVYQQFPDDSLVITLFAEALMDLRPWALWSATGEPAPETPELVALLEDGLRQFPDHPMLCHMYIHTMEASPTPQKAIDAANVLRGSMPDAGHLVHMPSHIDVLVGDYDKAIEANRLAIEADKKFIALQGKNNLYTVYRIHNYHFLVYGAMFDGQCEVALKAADELIQQIPDQMLRSESDMFDAFIPTRLHVLIRFGRWADILKEPQPADFLPMTRSIWHYARGIAYAATNRVEEAEIEQARFLQARQAVPTTSTLFNNESRRLLDVAQEMLRGEIDYRRGNYEEAFAALRDAVRLDDALNYDEPWGWMQPTRHALGALLIEQGHHGEAERVFRADLKRHPHNPWALQGLAESLKEQGSLNEATAIRKKLEAATLRSDVKIDRPCFCRLECKNCRE